MSILSSFRIPYFVDYLVQSSLDDLHPPRPSRFFANVRSNEINGATVPLV